MARGIRRQSEDDYDQGRMSQKGRVNRLGYRVRGQGGQGGQ